MDPLDDLELLIRSRYGLILMETVEEDRVDALLRHLSDRLGLPYFTWTMTKGLRREDLENQVYGTVSLIGALDYVESTTLPALYYFQGLQAQFQDALVVAKLKDAASRFQYTLGAIVLSGEGVELPEPLSPLTARVALSAPTAEEYRSLLQGVLADVSTKQPVRVELTPGDTNRLLGNLRGLTLLEARKILTKAVIEDGELCADDILKVVEAKKAVVEKEGLLEYTPASERLSDIADLKGLKAWLAQRREYLTDPGRAKTFGLSFPKGVLLLGVQGCGKSLCAKAVAAEWGLPLLKLDPSNLYNKYVGESERNFQRAMKTSERMAPVVLWIDEIEKAFAGSAGADDGGVSQRILGTFLAWLQDRKGDVFVVATANDISRLPPELLRKGRFDEIFFVDLPDEEVRGVLFDIHLKKRGWDPGAFDLRALSSASEGFSGAEIEQAIVSALYGAYSEKASLSTDRVLKEVSQTRPLSQTMSERISTLRDWAKERTVSAQ